MLDLQMRAPALYLKDILKSMFLFHQVLQDTDSVLAIIAEKVTPPSLLKAPTVGSYPKRGAGRGDKDCGGRGLQ